MLCVAKVNLSDWPEGQRREVDPSNERTVGLLRAGYIVPLQLPRRPAPETPPKPAEAQPDVAPSPELKTSEKPVQRAPRAK